MVALTRRLRTALVAVLVIAFWVAVPGGDVLYGSSRPEPQVVPRHASRWPAPEPITTQRSAPMVHRWTKLPLRLPGEQPRLDLHIEREAVDLHGIEPFERAAAQWSSVRGSRLRVSIAGVIDEGVDRNRYDGVNRVFINRRSCERPMLGLAHVRARETDQRFGRDIGHVGEVNIGLCPHLSAQRLEGVLLHEIGHAIGFGHLCEPADRHGCWVPEMGEGNRCRVMYVAVADCQRWEQRDDDALVAAYPIAPVVAGGDGAETAARLAHTFVPDRWKQPTIVVLDVGAEESQVWSAVAAAGALRAPLFIAPRAAGSCGRGESGEELSRVASFGAEVLLVGPAAIACGPQIESWQMETLALRDTAEVVDAVLQRLPNPHEVVVAGASETGRVPGGAVAAALAGNRRAPLLVVSGLALSAPQRQVLDDHRGLAAATVIGDRQYPRAPIARELRQRSGLDVRRITGDTDGQINIASADLQGGDTALVAAAGTVDALLAAAYAPMIGGFLITVDPPRMGAGAVRLLVDRAERAFVVGRSLAEEDDLRVSRWLDRRW